MTIRVREMIIIFNSVDRYFTVLFGVSRSIGICSQVIFFPYFYLQLFSDAALLWVYLNCIFSFVVQLIWDRALGLPLERPKSVTMEWLENYCKKAAWSWKLVGVCINYSVIMSLTKLGFATHRCKGCNCEIWWFCQIKTGIISLFLEIWVTIFQILS